MQMIADEKAEREEAAAANARWVCFFSFGGRGGGVGKGCGGLPFMRILKQSSPHLILHHHIVAPHSPQADLRPWIEENTPSRKPFPKPHQPPPTKL